MRKYLIGLLAGVALGLVSVAHAYNWTPYSVTASPISGQAYTQIYPNPTGVATTFAYVGSLSEFTIATLPTCNASNEGQRVFVTNGATSPTYLGTVSATGAVVVPVFCNGTNWLYN